MRLRFFKDLGRFEFSMQTGNGLQRKIEQTPKKLFHVFSLQQGQGQHKFPSGHYDIAMWDQGLRHGPATYCHPNGGKEEATYIEGYENGPSTVYFARLKL